MPDEILGIVDPEIGTVFCGLGRVLESAEEDDVVFVVGHAVSGAGWRGFAFGFDAGPFSSWGVEPPELGRFNVMIQNTSCS